jgi:hypothetical protein
VAGARDIDFPHVNWVACIHRDRCNTDGTLISKEVVRDVTSLDTEQAGAASPAMIARGQRDIETVYWLRDTAYAGDASTGYARSDPRSWPHFGIPSSVSTSSESKGGNRDRERRPHQRSDDPRSTVLHRHGAPLASGTGAADGHVTENSRHDTSVSRPPGTGPRSMQLPHSSTATGAAPARRTGSG